MSKYLNLLLLAGGIFAFCTAIVMLGNWEHAHDKICQNYYKAYYYHVTMEDSQTYFCVNDITGQEKPYPY